MLLDLPDSSDALIKSFKSKLRSQINRPLKQGLKIKSGGLELINDFYRVFIENMRDLGSPVHAKQLIKNVMTEFSDHARILLVHKDGLPLAAALTVGFNGTIENPWASALKRYSHLSPNMLLYWGMLDYAAQNGFARFDFGRSTPGEGTFKFKEQWGARPEPLQWYNFVWSGAIKESSGSNPGRFYKVSIEIWKRLPVAATRVLGPPVRKHISL
jgi:lipid II:glycine glycyltransferase (peptidoglycan interpeptide bridge formation enzyme)